MPEDPRVAATNELLESAGHIAQKYGLGGVAIVVYAAVHELKQNMSLAEAQKVIAEAWEVVVAVDDRGRNVPLN